MSNEFDFEKFWIKKFTKCVRERTNDEINSKVVEGSKSISKDSSKEEVITWTRKALKTLTQLTGSDKVEQILMDCACQYPKSELSEIKNKYRETKNIDLVHSMLQSKFEHFLTSQLEISEMNIKKIISKGWGLAGKMEGKEIIATKIPKSAFIEEYFNTDNIEKKRYLYCHCPRVRDALKYSTIDFPEIYCYCGAGFYKGIWEEILEKPVEVKMRKSVKKGDTICPFEIFLPT